jgi:hypothetical protein
MNNSNEIKTHYRDEEILIITLNQELEDWKKQLLFIEKELLFLTNLLNSISPKQKESSEKIKDFHNTLTENTKINTFFIDRTTNFSNKTMEIRECEDVDCETYFFNEHFEFHNKLATHLDKIRDLKVNIFDFYEAHNS